MTTAPDDPHVLLGAFVLGGLSDEDHGAFTEHLRSCQACKDELGQVSGLPRLLDLAGPGGGPYITGETEPGAPGPLGGGPGSSVGSWAGSSMGSSTGWSMGSSMGSPQGSPQLAHLLDEAARQRRRTRRWLAAAAAAAAVLLFAAGAWVGPRLGTTSPSATHYTAAAASGSAAKVDIALVTRGWGTQVDIACTNMPTTGQLLLWVVDAQGTARPVASWRATEADYTTVTGATALSPEQISRVEVRTDTGTVIATATT
ncbi:hypothetical protein N865_19015 [Intrasporangium oryzae NRRL B-24470]|uniref:Putative zinc-finger domain-containing protein n=1 Tax=Intrasporangium oryzae NRRL B-24470 TaxID=1386089 RepID=W9GDS5_9MICO|nr:zf-HC2 domain-containing protein [Intrasporangium oryzae]EWT03372.1 hypothetical protein N865_19015 [Intrasporangium oryzae NRRL B-24470]